MHGFYLVFILLFIVTLGCASQREVREEIPLPIENTKYVYKDRIVRDSIYIKESTDTRVVNDTIYITKTFNNRVILRDTIYVNSVDTLRIPVQVEKKVYVKKRDYRCWWVMGGVILLFIGYLRLKKII